MGSRAGVERGKILKSIRILLFVTRVSPKLRLQTLLYSIVDSMNAHAKREHSKLSQWSKSIVKVSYLRSYNQVVWLISRTQRQRL